MTKFLAFSGLLALPGDAWRPNGTGMGKEWKSIRKMILDRDENTCVLCGFRSARYLEVHHKYGEWEKDELDGLVTLCPFCHACHHVGLAGLREAGVLYVMPERADETGGTLQTQMNRILLESVRRTKDLNEFYKIEGIFRENQYENEGADGLVTLANTLVHETVLRGGTVSAAPARFLFFPCPSSEKWPILRFLLCPDR
jgi:hypothetical protein